MEGSPFDPKELATRDRLAAEINDLVDGMTFEQALNMYKDIRDVLIGLQEQAQFENWQYELLVISNATSTALIDLVERKYREAERAEP